MAIEQWHNGTGNGHWQKGDDKWAMAKIHGKHALLNEKWRGHMADVRRQMGIEAPQTCAFAIGLSHHLYVSAHLRMPVCRRSRASAHFARADLRVLICQCPAATAYLPAPFPSAHLPVRNCPGRRRNLRGLPASPAI